MTNPVALTLTKFQVAVIYHRLSLLTDSGMIAELYDDVHDEPALAALVASAEKYDKAMRKPRPMTIIVENGHDAEILAESMEGSTYFGSTYPTKQQRASVIALTQQLSALVNRTVVPVFS